MIVLLTAALAWPERGPDGVPTGREIDPAALFQPDEEGWGGAAPVVDPEVYAVAASALRYVKQQRSDPGVTAGALEPLGHTTADIADALAVLVETQNADRADGAARLADPDWWAEHFDLWRWTADDGQPDIRLTHYVVWQVTGSTGRTALHDTALYSLPVDDEGPDPSRLRFTRQDAYAGAYEVGGAAAGLARPLVWLTRRDADQAMLQGSVQVRLTTGGGMLLNVHKNNGIPYDRAVRDQSQQRRYWYFRAVDRLQGYHRGDAAAVVVAPMAAIAADVHQLGLGRLVLLDLPAGRRLVVLADTGGAFQPNLHQIDLLAGIFPDDAARRAATDGLPKRVPACIVVPRRRP